MTVFNRVRDETTCVMLSHARRAISILRYTHTQQLWLNLAIKTSLAHFATIGAKAFQFLCIFTIWLRDACPEAQEMCHRATPIQNDQRIGCTRIIRGSQKENTFHVQWCLVMFSGRFLLLIDKLRSQGLPVLHSRGRSLAFKESTEQHAVIWFVMIIWYHLCRGAAKFLDDWKVGFKLHLRELCDSGSVWASY